MSAEAPQADDARDVPAASVDQQLAEAASDIHLTGSSFAPQADVSSLARGLQHFCFLLTFVTVFCKHLPQLIVDISSASIVTEDRPALPTHVCGVLTNILACLESSTLTDLANDAGPIRSQFMDIL